MNGVCVCSVLLPLLSCSTPPVASQTAVLVLHITSGQEHVLQSRARCGSSLSRDAAGGTSTKPQHHAQRPNIMTQLEAQ